MEVQRCTRSMEAKARLVTKCVTGEAASLDDSKNHSSNPGSLSQDLTARLMCLQKCNELDNLTMPELRSIMKQMGKSFSGRKKELLVVLNRFLMEYASGKIGTTSPIEQGLLYKNDVGLENKNPECALLEDVHSKHKIPESVSCEVVVESATAKLVDGSIAQKRQRVRKGKKALATEDGREAAMLSTEPWAVLVHKKVQSGWVPYNPFLMRAAGRQPDDRRHLKLISWNVNGLRALVKKKDNSEQDTLILSQLASLEDFDIISLQETKLQEKDVENMRTILPNYKYSFWTCSVTKLGYSGTALISRVKPASVTYGLGVPGHDSEGRLITADFGSFFLVTAYVPNSGEKLQRLAYRTEEWDPALSSYLKELEKEKPVVLTGDLNCAHQEIDIYHPDGNRRSAGFTDEERASFDSHFLSKGFVDSFRRKHPNAVAYTYWGYRSGARPQNRGWRLDYFLTSDSMFGHVHDSFTIPHVPGSDHCPIGLVLDSSFNQHRE